MADYIDRQYAIEHYQHVCRRTNCKECPLHIQVTDTLTDCELELFLHNLPSADVVEVVRCRECKHRDPEDKKCDCGHGILWQLSRNDNWYCADGERKDDG